MPAFTDQILGLYPALAQSQNPDDTLSLLQQLPLMSIPGGTRIFSEHQPCQGFPLLMEGSIKVLKAAPSGREILLYRIRPGESCIVTSSCLLGHTSYTAQGFAESDLNLFMLPPPVFHQLVTQSTPFRDFVFNLFADRISELMQLVEEVAFARLDQRLAKLLIAKEQEILYVTHQQLAEELGSVREIVSRLLKGLAAQGLVGMGREQITLLDRDKLAQLAHGPH